MTMVQAIAEMHRRWPEHIWARPKAWKGLSSAYCIKEGRIYTVPSPGGGFASMMPDIAVILGEWELIDPHLVLDGK